MSAPATSRRPLVSVILSFRNEEEVLPELIDRLQKMFSKVAVDYELIFINDASTDRSLELLKGRASQDSGIKIINMSRRFGVAECILAGMKYSSGDAVITMDTDLQDPPEVIPQLVEQWLSGAEVVYTVRTQREGEPAFKIALTRLAYQAIRLVANEQMPVEAGDFKLIGRRAVNQLLQLNEKDPYLRGLVTWVGFKQTPVYYKRESRFKGDTHFPLFRSKGPITTFIFGFTSFSVLPLVFFLGLGLVLTSAFSVLLVGLVIFKMWPHHVPGNWWLLAAMGFFSGLQLMGIGTVGLYLGRVFNEVRNRPRYIVESMHGFNDAKKLAE